jgi:hypothetical protein
MVMNRDPIHILTKAGVLASFNVSKKITEEEINAMMKEAQNQGKNEEEILNLVKTKIMREIIDATMKGTLPGIIVENAKNQLLPVKSLESLNRMVEVLSAKMKQKKFDKLSLCYFINYLVGSLGLKEEDFDEFHRRIREVRGDDDDDDDDAQEA